MTNRKQVLGLDMGYESLKLVSLDKSARKINLAGYIEYELKEKLLENDTFKNISDAANIIKEACRKAKPSPIKAKLLVTTLPESFVFTKTIQYPKMSQKELKTTISAELDQHIPIPKEKVYTDYQVLLSHPSEALMDVLLVATPKALVDDYIKLANMLEMEFVALETKPIAAGRAIFRENKDKGALVCEIGTELTRISIWDNSSIRLNTTVNLGKHQLLESINAISVDDYKVTDKNKSDIIVPLSNIFEEILSAIKYHESRDYKPSQVGKIYLCGGGSTISGLDKLFSEELKIPSQRFESTFGKNKIGGVFTTALGAALRDDEENM